MRHEQFLRLALNLCAWLAMKRGIKEEKRKMWSNKLSKKITVSNHTLFKAPVCPAKMQFDEGEACSTNRLQGIKT